MCISIDLLAITYSAFLTFYIHFYTFLNAHFDSFTGSCMSHVTQAQVVFTRNASSSNVTRNGPLLPLSTPATQAKNGCAKIRSAYYSSPVPTIALRMVSFLLRVRLSDLMAIHSRSTREAKRNRHMLRMRSWRGFQRWRTSMLCTCYVLWTRLSRHWFVSHPPR